MRIVVVNKDSNLKTLLGGASGATLQRLQRFNPHIDFKKLGPGAVIVVPDAVGDIDFPAGDPKSIGAEAMNSFADFLKDALPASTRRVTQAAERAKIEEAALATALKSKGVKDALDKDPELKTLAEDAAKQAKEDLKSATADIKAFDSLAKSALAELAAMAKRLG